MPFDISTQTQDAKNDNESRLLAYPNARTVGVGCDADGNECIVVGVTRKVSEDRLDPDDVLPSDVDGVPVDVREVGVIEPEVLTPLLDRMGRHRPVPLGVSVAHPDVTAGSTGWCYERGDGTVVLGSNNHVMAASNAAAVGDDVLQPGPADGGASPDDIIGTLAYYTPIEDGVDVDLAVAAMDASVSNQLVGLDQPIVGVADTVAPGDELVKSGRTTGVTRASVDQVDATVTVGYGGDLGDVTISGCILTGDMSDGGDSGSPSAKEVSSGLAAAGRIFAGSDTVSVHHFIDNEIARLTDEFDAEIQLLTDDGEALPTASVTLTLEADEESTGTIAASVVDLDGNPLSSATVGVSGPVTDSKATDVNGSARFESIPIGEYTVTADKDGFSSAQAAVASGDFA